ncbi:MAG: hemerythrin domain-containing protein [Rhodospirillaceae bacterium]
MDLDSALTGKSGEPASAIRVLCDDHAEMRRLIAQYRDAQADSTHARHAIIQAIGLQAELHARIEEEVFYPAVQRLVPQFVEHAHEAHGTAAAKIDALKAMEPSEPEYVEIADQLIEALTTHMDDEERSLFPRVEKEMAGELKDLGTQLIRKKEQLTQSVEDMEGPAT